MSTIESKRKSYRQLAESLSRQEKDDLHEVYCDSTVTITQLAKEYGVTIAVMRRTIMELLGEEGYAQAKLQRAQVRSSKSWRKYKYKHASTKVFFKVLKKLLDTDKTFFEISKLVGCSRERVGQIANDCEQNGIKLNAERGKMLKSKRLYGKGHIRGYSKLSK
tara:strand:+ start:1823 stop:2311 length:489 start_codon:yes stop_codon:yes gene_type:complete